MRPRFDYGSEVRVIRNVTNDGTFPGKRTGDLLVRRGSVGYVKNIGTFLQDQIIYSIDFINEGLLVGCREEELIPIDEAWTPSRFEFREQVTAKIALGIHGEVVVPTTAQGQVIKVLRDAPGGVAYHVYFADVDKTLQVPETALESLEDNITP
jgi:nitrogen fixation protein NifZ